jgi:DNA polymerase-1
MENEYKKLLLVDGNNLIFRAFYATLYSKNKPLTNSRGIYTNASYPFARWIEKLKTEDHTHMVVALDAARNNFRKELDPNYKAHRISTPDELMEQMQDCRAILTGLNVMWIDMNVYEADDIIGSIAKQTYDYFDEIEIITGDKDLLQLINNKTKVRFTKKGLSKVIIYDEDYLMEDMGITPSQIIDLKCLMGDSSDNIKGITGVGPKTATKLIQKYGNVDNIYNNIDQLTESQQVKFNNDIEIVELAKKLVRIETDIDVTFSVEDMEKKPVDIFKLRQIYSYLEFESLLSKY